MGAGLIAVSRTMDYRHDVWDIGVGSVIGMGCAWKVYEAMFEGGEVREGDGWERVEDIEMGERGRA